MKRFLIVITVSLLLAAAAVSVVYFGIKFAHYEINIYEQICTYFILTLWAFSAVPAYVYLFEWLSAKSFEQAVWLVYVIGFVLPFLIAPVLMVIFYVSTIEKLIKKDRVL